MNKYRYPLSISKTLYIFEKLIVWASCSYAIHVLQLFLRELLFKNLRFTMNALGRLLHHQFKQGQKGSATARKLDDLVGRDMVHKGTMKCWFMQFYESRNRMKHKKVAERSWLQMKRPYSNGRNATRWIPRENCRRTSALTWLRGAGSKNAARSESEGADNSRVEAVKLRPFRQRRASLSVVTTVRYISCVSSSCDLRGTGRTNLA